MVASPARLTPIEITKTKNQSKIDKNSPMNTTLPYIKSGAQTHQGFHKANGDRAMNVSSVDRSIT